ncbi:MAG: Ig-like domain-containing protein [Bacteroidales bacterium]|nr:Ig-like domain-containing protein [Bacteroidales bacterium]
MYWTIIILLLYSCASQSFLTGGPEDNKPPEIVKVIPPHKSLNVKPRKIEFYFNEFITLNNIQQKLIISPYLNNFKIKPKPKGFILNISDTLLENTTYSFFFDNVIRDITEGNYIQNFLYYFSTGSNLDTLILSGHVYDAFNLTPEQYFIVGLYKDTFDSVVLKKKPDYITRTDKNGYFIFPNLKNGQYKIIAFDDKDKNYIWNPFTEKIAFSNNVIFVDSIQNNIKLYSYYEPRNKIYVSSLRFADSCSIEFEFNTQLYEVPSISVLPNYNDSIKITFDRPIKKGKIYFLQKLKEKDSIIISFTYKILDSLNNYISYTETKYISYTKIKPSKRNEKIKYSIQNNSIVKKNDTIIITLPFRKQFSINFKLQEFTDTCWNDIKNLKFTTDSINFLKYLLIADLKDEKKYKLITNFTSNIDTICDTLLFSTYEKEYYSSLLLDFTTNENGKNHIIQLIKDGKTCIKEWYFNCNTTLKEDYLPPGEYFFKIIQDENNNNKWDSGFYFKKILPEKVIMSNNPVKLRSNWEVEYKLNL